MVNYMNYWIVFQKLFSQNIIFETENQQTLFEEAWFQVFSLRISYSPDTTAMSVSTMNKKMYFLK